MKKTLKTSVGSIYFKRVLDQDYKFSNNNWCVERIEWILLVHCEAYFYSNYVRSQPQPQHEHQHQCEYDSEHQNYSEQSGTNYRGSLPGGERSGNWEGENIVCLLFFILLRKVL